MAKVIAIVPARCGSKGVPFKNLYKINNKPLLSYCLNAIKYSSIDECYVSTDCDEIIEYAKNYGVNTIRRPYELATDDSPTIDCVTHAIDYLNLDHDDIIITIQATNPFIMTADIESIINMLSIYEYAITVCEHHKVLWLESENNTIRPLYHNPLNRKRRQDNDKVLSETGSIYGSKVKYILRYNCLCGYSNVGYVSIPKSRSFEIDDYEDIKIIESILSNS